MFGGNMGENKPKRKNFKVLLLIPIALLMLGFGYVAYGQKNIENDFSEGVSEDEDIEAYSFSISPIPDDEVNRYVGSKRNLELDAQLKAKGIILYDLTDEKIMYSKNTTVRMAPASLTKIMTAILVLEAEDELGTVLEYKKYMGDEILNYGYSLSEIAAYEYKDGETMTVKDALHVLMMRSANDTANLLAEHYGEGSLENFVAMMNKRAEELGCTETNFSNAHGLDDENLYTTPQDMFIIFKHAIGLPGFLEIVGTVDYELSANNVFEARKIENVLGILNPKYPQYYYKNIVGAKSGYTDAAGKCLLTICKKDNKEYLMVLMGVPLRDENGDKYPAGFFYEETVYLHEWFLNK